MPLAPHELAQPRADGATSSAAQDTSAFGGLYKEHFDGLYDFVARIVRDRDLAGEIVQATFTKAWDELRAGHELMYPKAWLYTVARNQALDELRRRQRLTDEVAVYAQADPSRFVDPQTVAEDNELIELVWSSASALTADEYSLLDLHVRHGFEAAELADALKLERGAVYTRLSRLRNSLEESVASTLLVRRGSKECAELAAIVAEHDGANAVTPELRRAVRTHVKECEICTKARRRLVSPVALFGALVPVVPLAGVREGVLAAIVPGGAAHAAGASAAGAAGVATSARQGAKARYIAAGAGGLAAAGVVAALALTPGPSVSDPSQASSLDHSVGVASADPTVAMRWVPGKNAKGYSVIFSRDRSTEPPARQNVTGTRYTSQTLAPGRWWFILRSHGRNGGWTHTLRVGPFVITAAIARTTPRIAKQPPKRAKQHRVALLTQTPRTRPATKPATNVAVAVGVPTAPRAPKSAPRETPPKKKRTKMSPPHPVSPPPPATPQLTPPATVAPPAAPSPPAVQPVGGSPPAATAPPPHAEQGEPDEDDEHNDDGDDDDYGGDDGGRGHGQWARGR